MKDQRERLKRDIQALQKDLCDKLHANNISNQKAEELLKLRTKGISDAKLTEVKQALQLVI